MNVEILPVDGVPEVRPGEDLAALLAAALEPLGPRDGDVVAVTQKVVSKAEERVVPEGDGGRASWIERETRRVVARRGDLVIAETHHGFVCASAGVDASNVEPGFLTLLPVDPDASAARLRLGFAERLGVHVGVVVTDTFGRPWRQGLVNVAIGCAGLPAVVDLRGTADHHGRELEATVVALADEVAAASGLVIGKSSRVPAALVRGLTIGAGPGRARDLIRPAEDDLFRESPLLSISARRTIRSFADGEVPRDAVEEAVRAACTAPAPSPTRPWSFTALVSAAARRRLVAVVGEAWRGDLRGDSVPEDEIARRVSRSESVLGSAPVLIVPWTRLDAGTRSPPDAERAHADQEVLLLSAGGAIQNLLLAFHAQGCASCWTPSTLFCQKETRAALEMDDGWFALGIVAAGPMPAEAALPRPALDLGEHLRTL